MNLADAISAVRYFGIYPVFLGTWHRIVKKTGLLKYRFPTSDWGELALESFIDRSTIKRNWREILCPDRFFPVADVCRFFSGKNASGQLIIERADNVTNGRFKYFSRLDVRHGLPVNWHLNPFTGAEWPKDVHWCDIDYFVKENGDIKCAWEISRFSWAYDLVRAYAVTNDEKYVRTFWELLESWLADNQPNQGVNWVSGQECGLRIMAWCFALFAFLGSKASTEDRIERLLLAIAVHAERVEKFISHAIRQKTSHAMTEAAGLYTAGTLFPFFRSASRWRALGRKILEREGLRQIYEDGSYVQHSMNYHRLMLHTYLWCLRLAEINGESFSEKLKERLLNATEFLYQMQDETTGRVPNYGANDGALVLPLSNCDYLDYRPVIQSCWYLLKRQKLYERGQWDEDMVWFFGPDALNASKLNKQRTSCSFQAGGYYTLRAKSSWGMIRCQTYRDRVVHVDPLHLDVWANGINLLRDCGTYKYFAPDEPELELYFKSIWAHNTVTIDDRLPVRLVSRFIYLPWPKAELNRFKQGRDIIEWEGRSLAYDRDPWNVIHSRRVMSNPEGTRWEITDVLTGNGSHKVELRWHLPAEADVVVRESESVQVRLVDGWLLEVTAHDTIKARIIESGENGGWESLYYSHKQPLHTLSVVVETDLPMKFATTVWRQVRLE